MRRGRPFCTGRVGDVLATAAVATALGLPMIVGAPAFFNDWQNHLYLIAKQASYVERHAAPTFFLNTVDRGWFYPFYAFYGGTLYYAVALVGVALRSVWAAYVGSYVLAIAAAFAAWTWLSRQAGLGRPLAYLAGLIYVGGAYYLTNAYGRGAWPELVATSAMPMVLAAAWSALSRDRLTPESVVVLMVSVVVLTGSHIITLVYAMPLLAATILVGIAIFRPTAARPRRIAAVVSIAALAVGINAWFLVPLLRYRGTVAAQPGLLSARELDRFDVIFSLTPTNPLEWSTPQLYVQAPVIPLLAAITTIGVGAYVVGGRRLMAAATAILIVFGGILLLIVGDRVWSLLPLEARVIQFPYRLNIYVLVCAAGLVLVAVCYAALVRAVRPRVGAALLGLLSVAGVAQLGFAQRQVWTAETYGPAVAVLDNLDRLPATFYDVSYFNVTARSLEREPLGRASATADSLDVTSVDVVVPPDRSGREVRTNVILSPLIGFDPPRVVGRAMGYAVLEAPRSRDPAQFRAGAIQTPETLVGGLLTLVSAAGSLGVLGYLTTRHSRSASSASASSPTAIR